MLDLGFLPPIRRIVSQLPAKRQNLFFSATMPQRDRQAGRRAAARSGRGSRSLRRPRPSTASRSACSTSKATTSASLLVELFADPQMSRALVFTRTKRGADRVARHLEAAGIRVAAIHGNKSQSQREQALAAFRASKIRVLVATDIAARGIDVDQVTHVVNFELPDVPESYRPPHRPHGARRRRGHRHLAVRCGGARPAARHRAPDAAVDPGRGPAQQRLPRLPDGRERRQPPRRRNVPAVRGQRRAGARPRGSPAAVSARPPTARREDSGRFRWSPPAVPARPGDSPRRQRAQDRVRSTWHPTGTGWRSDRAAPSTAG